MEFNATFLATIVSFIVFVILMNKILYAPILNIIEERENLVETNYRSAKNTKIEIDKKTDYHNAELEKSRNEARAKISSTVLLS